MDTKIIQISKDDIDIQNLEVAAKFLRDGELVAFPTETVYGLGANALSQDAVSRIFEAKGRPSDNPLIVHLASVNDIDTVATDISDMARKLIKAFSPGPFTIILKKKDTVAKSVTAGLDTVAVRVPENPIAHKLIELSNVPIAAPSANISGKPSPTKAKHVIEDMNDKIACILDGGECEVGLESTVVDATGKMPIVLRPGGITVTQIRQIVPSAIIDSHILESITSSEKPKSPGMKYKHYAPNADVTVVEGGFDAVFENICRMLKEIHGKKTGVLAMNNRKYNADVVLDAGKNNEEYAHSLFTKLREFDEMGIDIVFAEFCVDDDYGLAVKNRLYKSAGNKIVRV